VIGTLLTLALTKRTADRTVSVEAQKLLLEINKALLAEPQLFSIYKPDDELHPLIAKHGGKLVAFGCLMINLFEIVFAQMPRGREHTTWQGYFEDSLDRCPLICDLFELREADKIYHENLMAAYRAWKQRAAAPAPPVA